MFVDMAREWRAADDVERDIVCEAARFG